MSCDDLLTVSDSAQNQTIDFRCLLPKKHSGNHYYASKEFELLWPAAEALAKK